MARTCGNCSKWSSTDQTWGYCPALSKDRWSGEVRAYVDARPEYHTEEEVEAEFRTRHNFGCIEWESLRAALSKATGEA